MTLRSPQPGQSVVIVGGGPAGLHLAFELAKRKVPVTVLEQAGEVGGKAVSRVIDGVVQELGPVYVTPKHHHLLALMESLGMDPAQELVPSGGPRGKRQVFVAGDTALDSLPLSAHLFAAVEEDVLPRWLRPFSPDLLQVFFVSRLVKRYNRLHRDLLGTYTLRHPPKPSEEVSRQLDCSFGELLRRHHLGALMNLMTFSTGAQGYGQPDELPAFYGLWWNSPEFLDAYLASSRRTGPPIVQLVKSGYAEIFRRLADALPAGAVQLGFRVLRIERGERIVVHGLRNGEDATVTADFLAWTPPLPSFPAVVADATERERALFGAMETHTVVATALSARSGSVTAPIAYWLKDKYNIADGGRLFNTRDSAAALLLPPSDRAPTWVAYQYVNRWDPDSGPALLERLRSELRGAFTEVEIHEQRVWPYATHFTRQAIRAGLPWELWELQGQHRTWYAGATACFDSVLDVMAHNERLLSIA